MTDKNIKLSIVVPVYNSERTLKELTERMEKVLENLVGDFYEIIFVNDGSSDASWQIIKDLSTDDSNLIAINLTRNFGQHNAIMCGFWKAQGKYIITIDDDLQIPPEEISKLFKEIQQGYDVVYGFYGDKQHSKFRNIGSKVIQFIYRKTFNMDIPISSFRILKQDIVQFLLSYKKSFTYIDGHISWFTKNIGSIEVEHKQRKVGDSGYSLKKLLILSLNMVTNFSIVPLQVASLTGILFATLGFFSGIFFIVKKIFFGISISGYASTIVAVTIFSGVQLLTVGLLGEYIGRIHINISKRPQYSIRKIIESANEKAHGQK